MQNLRLIREQVAFVDQPSDSVGLKLVSTDPENGHSFIVTTDNTLLHVDVAANTVIHEYVFSGESQYDFIAVQYLSDSRSVCLASSTGDILLVDVYGSKTEECVGTIETGITAMAWSPDFELVVFTTAANTMLVMTQDWDVIAEQPIIPETEKSTSASSQQAQADEKEAPIRNCITWRGDGAYFAISSIESGKCVFRVWERSCMFNSKSEAVSNQGILVAWRPTGEVIASTQVYADGKQDVIFFERNGLRHYEFSLRNKNCEVLDMKWNAGSDVLALLIRLADGMTVIQLWSTKNYYWYLKQELRPPRSCNFTAFYWDVEHQYILTMITHQGHIYQREFIWDVDVSTGLYDTNESLAAVIDGSRLLLTPFRRVVVPPPMCSAEVGITSPASETPDNIGSIDYEPESYRILVKHASGTLSFYNAYTPLLEPKKPPRYNIAPTMFAQLVPTEDVDTWVNLRQLLWISPTCIAGVLSTYGADEIVQINLNFGDKTSTPQTVTVASQTKTTTQKRILRFFQNKDTRNVYVELDDGVIMRYEPATATRLATLTPVPFAQLPAPCHWTAAITMADEECIVGLSVRSKLYINGTLVSGDCNSFAVHSEFLLFTTVSHSLRCLYLRMTVDENLAILSKKRPYDETIREVEQGSHIIAVVPNDTRLVLQMPRGNLETIEPRALVVSKIRKLIDSKDYKQAFIIARKNRIDLNLLYDHNPTQFLENLELFVTQLDSVEYINLFLSSLSKEDVTQTMFVCAYKKTSTEEEVKAKLRTLKLGKGAPPNKVTVICDALLPVFKKLDASTNNKYLLCTITALVRREPPQIEEALKFVQQLRGLDQGAEVEVGKPSSVNPSQLTAEKALKYLIFLVDVNVLYDIALGMYDFDLVLMVAQKSQKDPREYLPFLADLQKQSQYYQRYLIDKHLQKWASALENLSKETQSEYFEELLEFTKERKLYAHAIEIYEKSKETEKLNRILDAYGEYLVSQKHYGQAALMWRRANMLEKAMDAYAQYGDWRSALGIAHQLNRPQEFVTELARQMAAQLVSRYQYEDAGFLYEHYCSDPAEAVTVYIQGHLWDNALFVCQKHGLQETIDNELIPAIVDSADTLTMELNETLLRFIKYHNRLLVVRANKYLQSKTVRAPVIEGSEAGSIYTASDAGSSDGETMSESSKASSYRGKPRGGKAKGGQKRRSRPSRRAAGAKKGSPYEEQYLVTELRQMIPTEKLQEEVKYLLRYLVMFGHREKAAALQKVLRELLRAATAAVPLLNTKLAPIEDEDMDEAVESEMSKKKKKQKDELIEAVIDPVNIETVSVANVQWELDLLPQ